MNYCATCRHWAVRDGSASKLTSSAAGVCRRYAPRPMTVCLNGNDAPKYEAVFPTTYAAEGCGEWAAGGSYDYSLSLPATVPAEFVVSA